MNKQNLFAAWITEFVNRFGLKTGRFFQILQTAGLICTGIGFLPDILQWLEITPTPIVSKYVSLAVKVAGGVTWIISKLPVHPDQVQSEKSNLPFTQKQ